VVRDRRTRDIAVRLGEFEAAQPVAQPTAARETAQQRLGFAVVELGPQARQQLGVDESVQGVVVTTVTPHGPAAGTLARGDIILELNRQPVRNVRELERAAQQVSAGDVVVLRIRSAGTGNVGVRSYRVR
jgi:serine protease Do